MKTKCYSAKPRDISRKKFTQSSTDKHTSHDTRANNCKRSGNKKSVIILGDSMNKLLNGWQMTNLTVKPTQKHFPEQRFHAWRII